MVLDKKINCIQWFLLVCISLGRYFEVTFLFLLLFSYKWYRFNKIAILFLLLLAHFCITNYFIGYPANKFAQQFILLFLLSISYYQFFLNYVPDIQRLWNKYIKLCVFLSYFGFAQFLIYIVTNVDISNFISFIDYTPQQSYRLRSYFLEPGYFATFIIPAVSYCFLQKGYWKLHKKQTVTLVTALLLTFATIGYATLSLFFLYRFRKIIWKYCYLLITPIILVISFVFHYSSEKQELGDSWQTMIMKTSESMNAFSDFEPEAFEVLNLSTYALLTNLWVANEAPCRLTGTGLGTHEVNYETKYQSDFFMYGLNQTDAYSLFTRLYSEFGIIGLVLVFYLLFKYKNDRNPINIAILMVFISYFIRGGHYFIYGVIFYAYLFYYTSSLSIKKKKVLYNKSH